MESDLNSYLNFYLKYSIMLLRWKPAHKGYLGNEKADELAKRGSGDNEAQDVTLPVPRTAWRNALRQRSHRKMRDRLKDMPPHFRTVWGPSLSNLGERINSGQLPSISLVTAS